MGQRVPLPCLSGQQSAHFIHAKKVALFFVKRATFFLALRPRFSTASSRLCAKLPLPANVLSAWNKATEKARADVCKLAPVSSVVESLARDKKITQKYQGQVSAGQGRGNLAVTHR